MPEKSTDMHNFDINVLANITDMGLIGARFEFFSPYWTFVW